MAVALAVRLGDVVPFEGLVDGEDVQRRLVQELALPELVVGAPAFPLGRIVAVPRRGHRVGRFAVVVEEDRHADEVRVRTDDRPQPLGVEVAAVRSAQVERHGGADQRALGRLDGVALAAVALPTQRLLAGRPGRHGDPVGHDERAQQPDAELPDQLDGPAAIALPDPLAQLLSQLVGAGPADRGQVLVDLGAGQARAVVVDLDGLHDRVGHHLNPR